jgi:AraC-like DNA-binding protein
MTIVPTVDARWAGLAADRLRDEDPEFQAVLYEAGLRLADVDDPDARIPFHMHAALLEIAARRLGDPLFGLRLGARIHPKRAGLLGAALLGASTVEDALLSLERYLRVTGEGVQLDVEIKRKHTILTVTIEDPRVAAKRQAVEFAMILLVSLCRSLTDTLVEPVRIEFEHAPPEKIGVFNRTFGAPVRFEAPRNAIVLNTDDLDLPVRTVETPLSRRLEGHRREVLDSPPRVKGLPRRVREQIARLLSTSDSSIEAVARNLAISARTLERRLKVDGQIFKRVIDDFRRDLALRYMEDETLTLPQIAFLLGYSEMASFMHACQRWTGTTPARYRASRGHTGPTATTRGRPRGRRSVPGP